MLKALCHIVCECSPVARAWHVAHSTREVPTWFLSHIPASLSVTVHDDPFMAQIVLSHQVGLLRKEAERARAETLLALGGDLSSSNCYLELQAGAGGTESHDWTNMLLKMYTRWAEKRGFSGKLLPRIFVVPCPS